MSNSPGADKRPQLRNNLDSLASRAERVLGSLHLKRCTRQLINQALMLMFLFPIPVLLIELGRFVTGNTPWGLGFWSYAGLSLLAALLYVAARLLGSYLKLAITRRSSLALFDRQMGLSNRLTAADEFMAETSRCGFMEAAIDDATQPAEKALLVQPNPITGSANHSFSRWSLASIPATVGMLMLSMWVGGLQLATADEWSVDPLNSSETETPKLEVDSVEVGSDVEAKQKSSEAESAKTKSESADSSESDADQAPESDSGETSMNRGGQPMPQQPENQQNNQQSSGMPAGSSSQSQSASAGGQQSQASAEKPEESEKKGSDKMGEDSDDQKQSGDKGEKEAGDKSSSEQGDTSKPEASDSQAGGSEQGDVSPEKGSESKPSGDQQESTGEQGEKSEKSEPSESDEGDESDEESDDEGKPSEKKPNKTKEGEGNQPGPPGGKPSESEQKAEGEGGKGRSSGEDDIKKSRGAPSAILGVPQVDRLEGKMGQGPETKKQQQSQPAEEPAAPLASEQRSARNDRIGDLQHAKVSAWSRELVENYFNNLRTQAKDESTNTVNNSKESEGDK